MRQTVEQHVQRRRLGRAAAVRQPHLTGAQRDGVSIIPQMLPYFYKGPVSI